MAALIVLTVAGCAGDGDPGAAPAAEQAVLPGPSGPSVPNRRGNEVDFDTVLAGLTGAAREEVQGLVDAARNKRREVAQWLGEAIEAEQQAREYRAAGETELAASAFEQAAGKRRRAKEILAEARADEARALKLAAASTGPAH